MTHTFQRCIFLGRELYSDNTELVEYMLNYAENQPPTSEQTIADCAVFHEFEWRFDEIPVDKIEAYERGKAALKEKDNLFERRFPGVRVTAIQAFKALEATNVRSSKLVYINGVMQAWGREGLPGPAMLNMALVELEKR
jgi:hypothetical protein